MSFCFIVDSEQIETQPFLHMRYDRTDCALMIPSNNYPASESSCKTGDFKPAFQERYCLYLIFTVE